MVSANFIVQSVLALATVSAALATPFKVPQEHYEVLKLRANTNVNPDAVLDTKCTDPSQNIVFHDANVALLGICGGIAGAITKCGGNPTSTTGESGTAKFTLNAVDSGATINVSKGRWEGCVRAARAVCPTGSFSSTCVGGASTGNVAFTLANP